MTPKAARRVPWPDESFLFPALRWLVKQKGRGTVEEMSEKVLGYPAVMVMGLGEANKIIAACK